MLKGPLIRRLSERCHILVDTHTQRFCFAQRTIRNPVFSSCSRSTLSREWQRTRSACSDNLNCISLCMVCYRDLRFWSYAVACGVGKALGDITATNFACTTSDLFGDFLSGAVIQSTQPYPEFLQGAHCELSIVTRDILTKLIRIYCLGSPGVEQLNFAKAFVFFFCVLLYLVCVAFDTPWSSAPENLGRT